MIFKRDPSRALQIGFLILLVVSTAQVAWWIADQVRLAHGDRDRMRMLFEADASAVGIALAALPPSADKLALAARLEELLPHLEIDDERASLRPSAASSLGAEADSRINRYAWEGGFFLLVLLAGMGVLTGAIRQDARLRHRQQTFLAAVSHEFKSPLASMRLSAETLALRGADIDSQRLGQRLLEDGDRLLNMVDNLLDTARIDEQQLRLRRDVVALAPLVAAASNRLQAEAASHGIAIRATVAEELALVGDAQAIEIVLHNLLDNAVKACVAGDGGEIEISARRTDRTVALTVTDDGMGFPPRDADNLFDKFYRVADSPTPGTGLGLYIVARLAAMSGAKVRASSAGAGKGATLALDWPAPS